MIGIAWSKARCGFDRNGDYGPERKCSTCGEWWPLSFFTPMRGCKLGRSYRCCGCKNRQRIANRRCYGRNASA